MLFDILNLDITMSEKIMYLTVMVMVLTFTFSIHEFMHAWVAEKMGDDTPRRQGRITLNPLAHIDPLGTIMLFIAGFGWAKPVQYNPNNLKRFRRPVCERYISLAGVTANFVVGFIATLIVPLARYWHIKTVGDSETVQMIASLVEMFFYFLREYNFLFLAFNLLPIPPLDGYRFISTIIPYKWRTTFDTFAQYSYFVFFALIILGRFGNQSLLSDLINLVAKPFRLPANELGKMIYEALDIPRRLRL